MQAYCASCYAALAGECLKACGSSTRAGSEHTALLQGLLSLALMSPDRETGGEIFKYDNRQAENNFSQRL